MPIRAPDPHNLRNAARTAVVIDSDRECAGCGYNLRGLRVGFPCPECGTRITGSLSDEIDDPLSLAPPRVILAFIRGCWAASLLVAIAVGMTLAARVPPWGSSWFPWALFPLSILWVGAVAWLTPAFGLPQAASRGFNRRSKLRNASRWLQLGWALAAGLNLLVSEGRMNATLQNLCHIGVTVGCVIGVVGVIMLSVLLERLAEWARDDTAETLFNWAAWSIPITTLLLLVDIPLPVVNLLFGLLWLAGIALFPFALISLSGSVTLSVVHNYEHRERSERRAERQRKYDEQVERTVRTMDAERARRGNV